MKVFHPEQPVFSESMAVIKMNHMGSSENEDAGRDGSYLADKLRITTIVVDRPGTGMLTRPGMAGRLSRDYVGEVNRVAEQIAPEVSDLGITSLVATDRSAGALGVLALAVTERLPIKAIYTAEPVGMYDTTRKSGKKDYSTYQKAQGTWRAKAAEVRARIVGHERDPANYPPFKIETEDEAFGTQLILPDGSEVTGLTQFKRLASMGPLAVVDQLHNQDVWRQSLAVDLLKRIAKELVHTYCEVDFAERSMVAQSNRQIALLREELKLLRDEETGHQGAPILINQVPFTTHSSFDKRSFFAERLDSAIKYVFNYLHF